MTRRLVAVFVALYAVLLFAGSARATTLDRAAAEADTQAAMAEGKYGFCASPSRPLSPRAMRLCPLAGELTLCEGFAQACADQAAPKKIEKPWWWSELLAKGMGYVALGIVGLAVLAAVVAMIVAIVRLIRAAEDDRAAREPDAKVDPVQGVLAEVTDGDRSDAEALLRAAAERAREGKLDLALFLYLAASLSSLGERGLVRLGREVTLGEHVRACKDGVLRPLLRAIVREVEVVRFGGQAATTEMVARAEESARGIVRAPPALGAAARVGLLAMGLVLLGACSGGVFSPGSDPAGDDLLLDLLVREGATARHMTGSLSTLPMNGHEGAAVIVNVTKTPLDEETEAHLLAWVSQGGSLILAGDPEAWPKELWARRALSTARDGKVETPCPVEDDACTPPRIDRLHLAAAAAVSWPHDRPLTTSATLDTGELYAALRPFGQGTVLGLASDDLLTNAGLSVHGNPSALIAMLESLEKDDFLVTRAENGVAPPTNPFAGLIRIGLGLGLLHALGFTLLLFFSVGVRHARPVPTPPPLRRAFAEHVTATGSLYARSRATAYALFSYARYVDQQLRARAPRGTSPSAFLAQRADADPQKMTALYERVMAVGADDKASGEHLLLLRQLSSAFSTAMSARGEGKRR